MSGAFQRRRWFCRWRCKTSATARAGFAAWMLFHPTTLRRSYRTNKANTALALERAEKIRELREKHLLTQAAIAERFGITLLRVRTILRQKKDDEAPARLTG